MSEWYHAAGGEQQGPVSAEEMDRLIAEGTVTPETLVWRAGMGDWEPASQHFPQLRGMAAPPALGARPGDGPGVPRTFGEAIQVCFEKYADFTGRASRSEFWWWQLFTILLGLVTSVVPVLNLIASLAVLVPGLAVSVRRLHDIGRSGWWLGGFYLAAAVFAIVLSSEASQFNSSFTGSAIVGIGVLVYAVVLLVWYCTPGQPGRNRYN